MVEYVRKAYTYFLPATMITSAWRGDALNTTPNLSMSYLGAAMCIISTAQQAKPNVNGHIELLNIQKCI